MTTRASDPANKTSDLDENLVDPQAVKRLVEQLFLARMDGFDAPQVAAFVAGWTNALQLVSRCELFFKSETPEVQRAVLRVVSAVEVAGGQVLTDSEA